MGLGMQTNHYVAPFITRLIAASLTVLAQLASVCHRKIAVPLYMTFLGITTKALSA